MAKYKNIKSEHQLRSLVFDTGKELWKYYLGKPRVNINASLYDIKSYF
jgi:hypothetical protein